MQTQSKQATQPIRKPYVAPILEEYGAVRELTNATQSFPGYFDSGTGPNLYSSTPN